MRVAAVDLGATSVRVVVVDLAEETPRIDVVHRWRHVATEREDGSLRWCWSELLRQVRLGLDAALGAGPLASIAIDGWAVDYGLLDERGRLLSDPHSYRSARTDDWQEVLRSLGATELYRRTGIQLMRLNTIFQLAAHDRAELGRAARLLMLPELVAYDLTGATVAERTNAGTTGLVDVTTGDWCSDLLEAVGVEPSILPSIEGAGRAIGDHRGVPVHLVATHDTACAVAAAPLSRTGTAFVVAGTWFLVGIERGVADVSDEARGANFSNEPGAVAGFRFLKNVPGFWLLERCAAEWAAGAVPELLGELERLDPSPRMGAVIDLADPALLAPGSMDAAVRSAAGLDGSASRTEVVAVILSSLANGVAAVVAELPPSTPVTQLALVGGASSSPLLRLLLRRAAGVRVITGPAEASALGNALLQGIALGRFESLTAARAWAAGKNAMT